MAYFKKYGGLLKAKNLLYVKQLLNLLRQLLLIFQNSKESNLSQLSDFLIDNGLMNLNLYKLIRYIEKSRISHKLHGFHKSKLENDAKKENTDKKKGVSEFLKRLSTKEEEDVIKPEVKSPEVSGTNSPLLPILAFMQSLVNSKRDYLHITSSFITFGAPFFKLAII